MSKVYLIGSSLLCLLLLVFSAIKIPGEISPFSSNDISSQAYFDSVAGGHTTIGQSLYARKIVLEDCYSGVVNVANGWFVSQKAKRTAFVEQCLNLAESALQTAPLDSYAWALKATIHAQRNEATQFRDAYVISRNTGAHEIVPAIARASAAVRYAELADEALTNLYNLDLLALGQSQHGRSWLVDTYVKRPQIRDQLLDALEGLQANDKMALVDEIGKALKPDPL